MPLKDISAEQGKALLANAITMEGKPYNDGAGPASNPKDGFDCSGLVWYVIAKLGKYNFEYRYTATLAHHPLLRRLTVPPEVLQEGDLVLFHGHVGLYDPNPLKAGATLYSATSHGVRHADPKFWGKPLSFHRLQVPQP